MRQSKDDELCFRSHRPARAQAMVRFVTAGAMERAMSMTSFSITAVRSSCLPRWRSYGH